MKSFLNTKVRLVNPVIEGLSPQLKTALVGLEVSTSDPYVLNGSAIIEAAKKQRKDKGWLVDQLGPILQGKVFFLNSLNSGVKPLQA